MSRPFVYLAALCVSLAGSARAAENFDVVVYGATPAGVFAATAAARAGAKVALVEPLPLVGGMMSSGLSFSDSNQTDRRTLGGLFEEFHLRVEADYKKRGVTLNYQVAVKDNHPWTYEPHVAEQVFQDLLREAGVKIFTGQQLVSATKEGARIQQIKTDHGEFAAREFVDASYEGDLMAAAKVSFVIGRESKEQYDESLAGQQFKKPRLAVSPRDAAGKLLPLMTAESAGPDGGDGHIMTYSWRIIMTKVPENRVPLEKPANYDPARFELARRILQNAKDPRVVGVDIYPIPGDKVDVNNGIGKQLSMGLIGAADAWPAGTPAERAKIWQAHKDYALELLWFLGHDPAVPEATRADISSYGFAKDEFAKSDYWPPVIYIREARRMLGEVVLTQADIRKDITKPDSIGIGSFPVDSHDCQRVATEDGGVVNEGTIFPVHMAGVKYGQPYQLPYRAITPERTECENLLVPVCLSASHVALSSVRVEPTWMVLGQSAGVAAALAAKSNVAVQELSMPELQKNLREAKQVLDLQPEHLAAVQ
ncbi:MAG: FAD-dependent oxidoreductase [Chthoniobacter sp.]